jgi:DNA-binding transcriptional MerR regulator
MSIGEVLAVLKTEFGDITVSKIRFLEGEGLIDPERTASGYRKFYTKDLERLRQILRLQRDAFLPLKVIRERIDAGDTSIPAAVAARPAPSEPATNGSAPEPAPREDLPDDLDASTPGVRLTESDLADATGLELGQIQQMREFGALCLHTSNGTSYYDDGDVAVAQIARDLFKLGIEPRHMKQLRRFAEQEADMFGQLVTPSLRNRRPEARTQAVETLAELSRLSRRLRHTYVRQSLRTLLRGER